MQNFDSGMEKVICIFSPITLTSMEKFFKTGLHTLSYRLLINQLVIGKIVPRCKKAKRLC